MAKKSKKRKAPAERSKKSKVLQELQPWIQARERFHLSNAQVQMARELGLNPRKLGGLANHDQEAWKLPLPLFIEELYLKRFQRTRPERVLSIEERAAELVRKAEEKKMRKRLDREAGPAKPDDDVPPDDVA